MTRPNATGAAPPDPVCAFTSAVVGAVAELGTTTAYAYPVVSRDRRRSKVCGRRLVTVGVWPVTRVEARGRAGALVRVSNSAGVGGGEKTKTFAARCWCHLPFEPLLGHASFGPEGAGRADVPTSPVGLETGREGGDESERNDERRVTARHVAATRRSHHTREAPTRKETTAWGGVCAPS